MLPLFQYSLLFLLVFSFYGIDSESVLFGRVSKGRMGVVVIEYGASIMVCVVMNQIHNSLFEKWF